MSKDNTYGYNLVFEFTRCNLIVLTRCPSRLCLMFPYEKERLEALTNLGGPVFVRSMSLNVKSDAAAVFPQRSLSSVQC